MSVKFHQEHALEACDEKICDYLMMHSEFRVRKYRSSVFSTYRSVIVDNASGSSRFQAKTIKISL